MEQSQTDDEEAPQEIQAPVQSNPTTKKVVENADDRLLNTLDSHQKQLDDLNKRVSRNSERVSLLGIVVNENSVIVKNNYDRSHSIVFNRDWTIDKMPQHLRLSEEDTAYLQKFVLEPQAHQ